jgi:hypothetical protein
MVSSPFRLSHVLLLPWIILTLISFPSCTHEPVTIDELDTVCFNTQVLPLLQASCGTTGCHGSGEAEEDFSVSSYEMILQSVVPGDPRASDLYNAITGKHGQDMMPPDQPLSQAQRTTIQVWIAQGAKETTCDENSGGNGENKDSVCFVQDILPVIASGCGTTGCHDAVTQADGYVLTSYSGIMEGVKPFDPDDSEIYEVVTKDGDDRMPPPPRDPLTSAQITALRQWIMEGALNSDCPEEICDTAGVISYSAQVDPLLQANCVGCHNPSLASGGVILSSYDQVAVYVTTLRNEIPILTGVINRQIGFEPMPPTFSLDACSIRKIELWIEQGAEDN